MPSWTAAPKCTGPDRPFRCPRRAWRAGRMFTVELYAGIRRAVMVDGLSRREAAKRFGVHRNTITKMLQFSVPPGYRRRERPMSKKLGPFMVWIDKVLEEDRRVHKKQRHTAQRIFERLRDEE